MIPSRSKSHFFASFGVLLVFFQSLIFQAAPAFAGDASFETIRNVAYATHDGKPIEADIYLPEGEGPFPAVLCIHGGAWVFGKKSQLTGVSRQLARAGYVAVSIDYRLAPKHKFPAQIDDCREALAWMRANAEKYKIDPDHVAAWGYSAGAHLATLLGVGDTGLDAVVAGGTPCEFRDLPPDSRFLAFFLGGSREDIPEVYDAASPITHVSPDDPPMFFYHGERDNLVPVEQPKAMVAALQEAGVTAELRMIPKLGHMGVLLSTKTPAEGIEFLTEHMPAK